MFPSLALLSEIVSQPFKRAQNGLFHGKMKRYGNNVPFSKHKTRRTWLPNVQSKRLPSEALGCVLKLKVTTRALRTIKKHGGLDKYVQKTSAALLGDEGMRLRLLVQGNKTKGLPPPQKNGPQLSDALKARMKVGKALGLQGPASAGQTITYLKTQDVQYL